MGYGLYDCDEYVYTPYIYSENYVEELITICKKHDIDLLIPGMDDEAHILSKNIKKFDAADVKVIVAGEAMLNICRDKEMMSNKLSEIADIFVKTYDKNKFLVALSDKHIDFPVLAKPRSGCASRGIEIIRSHNDLFKISGDHVIQMLAVPHKDDPERRYYDEQLRKNINPQVAELSIQLVADLNGTIVGKMISYNKLNNGIPIAILPFDSNYIWEQINRLLPVFKKIGLKGPLNLQGRLTDDGLKLFEMNARFTGITGLRAYMGFNEVEACIKIWLGIGSADRCLSLNENKFGVRQMADKAIDLSRNSEVKQISSIINKKPLKIVKNLLITGATGYLGRNLIDVLSGNAGYSIWALVRDKKRAQSLLPENVVIFDNKDYGDGTFNLGNVDVLLHAGFARPHHLHKDIADSLRFSCELFSRAVMNQVPTIINISSQSVYNQEASLPPWSEDAVVAPDTTYGAAKLAAELTLNSLALQHHHINFTSLRLNSISGGAKGLLEVDVLSKLVKKAMNSEQITIVGGAQQIERLDIRDAVQALIMLLNNSMQRWEPVYNLGAGRSHTLFELTQKVIALVSETLNKPPSVVTKEEKDLKRKAGLNSNLFYRDFGWRAQYPIEETIKSLVVYYQNHHDNLLLGHKKVTDGF